LHSFQCLQYSGVPLTLPPGVFQIAMRVSFILTFV